MSVLLIPVCTLVTYAFKIPIGARTHANKTRKRLQHATKEKAFISKDIAATFNTLLQNREPVGWLKASSKHTKETEPLHAGPSCLLFGFSHLGHFGLSPLSKLTVHTTTLFSPPSHALY